ncbi:hypothetical protein DFQ28_001940, partial [Apophysomyces sp. BC1034]
MPLPPPPLSRPQIPEHHQDVQFPAKGTVTLLVHSEYYQGITESLESHGISAKKEFNTFAADIIGDQQHANKTIAEREQLARNIFAERQ